MRKLSFLPPLLAIFAGIAGLFLRNTQINTIFDSITGLAQPFAPVSIRLYILSGALVLCTVIFSVVIGSKYIPENSYEKAFSFPSFAILALCSLLGISLSAVSVIWLLENVPVLTAVNISELLFFLLSFLSGISFIIMAIGAYTGKKIISIKTMSVIPCMFFCLWLLEIYKENSTNPVLLDYCFPCFACIAASLAFFYTAGFVFRRPKPRLTIVFNLISIYFCTLSLADTFAPTELIILLICMLFQATTIIIFLSNLSTKSNIPK